MVSHNYGSLLIVLNILSGRKLRLHMQQKAGSTPTEVLHAYPQLPLGKLLKGPLAQSQVSDRQVIPRGGLKSSGVCLQTAYHLADNQQLLVPHYLDS